MEISISLQEKQERAGRYVRLIATHAIKAKRVVPGQQFRDSMFNNGDHVVISIPYHQCKALTRREMAPCTTKKSKVLVVISSTPAEKIARANSCRLVDHILRSKKKNQSQPT